jgi:hypothetical protein
MERPMSNDNDRDEAVARPGGSMKLTLIALAVFVMAVLVLVDNQKWFELRPATGTAAAMYHASDRAPATTATPR